MAFGLLNIDKPAGYTSHDIVNIVRKKTKIKKLGHAGTLDPLATGVLILCVGAATRLSEYIMGHTKTYQALVTFGKTTDTYDAEGAVTATDDTPITRDQLAAILPRFTGYIQQVPPMYSAIKKDGKKLYELARQGEEIERDPREVVIYKIQIDSFAYPDAVLTVRCGSGTYIRSLAYDLGAALGVGAHLGGLIRVASGDNFTIGNAVSLRQLEKDIEAGTWEQHLMSVREGLSQFPYIELNNHQESVVRNGQFLQLGISNRGLIQVWSDDGDFIGIMERRGDDDDTALWKPKKVFGVESG